MPGRQLSGRPDGALIEAASQFGVVYFDFDSAQVNPGERSKLEAVAAYLRDNAGVGLVVEGHCDERGSNEYNLALGERRALAVRAYLVGSGCGRQPRADQEPRRRTAGGPGSRRSVLVAEPARLVRPVPIS
jgi:outer membrane protein OmpA-like peptidoglycan-associated protein